MSRLQTYQRTRIERGCGQGDGTASPIILRLTGTFYTKMGLVDFIL